MAAYDSELHKYNWNKEIIETPNQGIIFESIKFNLKVIVRPTTVWQPFWIYWFRVSVIKKETMDAPGSFHGKNDN